MTIIIAPSVFGCEFMYMYNCTACQYYRLKLNTSKSNKVIRLESTHNRSFVCFVHLRALEWNNRRLYGHRGSEGGSNFSISLIAITWWLLFCCLSVSISCAHMSHNGTK